MIFNFLRIKTLAFLLALWNFNHLNAMFVKYKVCHFFSESYADDGIVHTVGRLGFVIKISWWRVFEHFGFYIIRWTFGILDKKYNFELVKIVSSDIHFYLKRLLLCKISYIFNISKTTNIPGPLKQFNPIQTLHNICGQKSVPKELLTGCSTGSFISRWSFRESPSFSQSSMSFDWIEWK